MRKSGGILAVAIVLAACGGGDDRSDRIARWANESPGTLKGRQASDPGTYNQTFVESAADAVKRHSGSGPVEALPRCTRERGRGRQSWTCELEIYEGGGWRCSTTSHVDIDFVKSRETIARDDWECEGG